MKKFKRFVFSLLISKQERIIIWDALNFSNHTYRRRGNVDGAATVQMVINSLSGIIGAEKKVFKKEEVQRIVEEVATKSFLHGFNSATAESLRNCDGGSLDVDIDFSKECPDCKSREECLIHKTYNSCVSSWKEKNKDEEEGEGSNDLKDSDKAISEESNSEEQK